MLANFSSLVGKTLTSWERRDDGENEELIFKTSNETFRMFHNQDCCETVRIEDICGNMDDLIGSPILQAEVSTNEGKEKFSSFTWTFYRIATIKGSVVIRWYGSSNGYYSEYVSFEKVK